MTKQDPLQEPSKPWQEPAEPWKDSWEPWQEPSTSCTESNPCKATASLVTTSRSGPRSKAVNFSDELHVQSFEPNPPPPNSRPRKSRLKMAQVVYEKYDAGQVTDTMLQEAAVLFSENYGVWGEQATGKFTKPGKPPRTHLRLSAN